MSRGWVAIALLAASSAVLAQVPPPVTISAHCGNGAPTSFGPGGLAREHDGSIYRNPWWKQGGAVKVARDPALVRRLQETLNSIDFDRVVFDKAAGPWCGVVRTTGRVSHAVRWPVWVDSQNVLHHEFAGMPEQVWFVYLQLYAAATRKTCTDEPPDQGIASIALNCATEGVTARNVSTRILANGDIVLSELQSGKHCSTVIGTDSRLFRQWEGLLAQARLETNQTGPGPIMPGSVCGLTHAGATGSTHRVQFKTGAQAPLGWRHVEQVAGELAALSWGHLPFDPSTLIARTQRVQLLDRASKRPLARTEIIVSMDNGVRCIRAPCPVEGGTWRTTSDANGVIVVPAFLLSGIAYFETDKHAAQAAHLGRRDASGLLILELP